MRSAPKSEQEKQEIEASERTDRRKGGFDMMSIRDRGWGRLRNGAVMVWHTDAPLSPGQARSAMPDGYFLLDLGKNGKHLFEKEEFMRWLRWV